MKILITGFDPFGGEKINPAYEAVKLLSAPEGTELIKLQLPTVFGKSLEEAISCIKKEKPDVIICVGQAGGRAAVTPERVAINIMDASSPDNLGNCPVDMPVIPGGKAAYFSTLPVKAMVEAIKAQGVAAQLSNSAGTFVCNQLMYGVLQYCEENLPGTRAGFIHVPYLPSQAEKKQLPSLSLEDMVKALNACLRLFSD